MMSDRDDVPADAAEGGSLLSRRQALTAAGVLVAAAEPAAAQTFAPAGAVAAATIGVAPPPANAVEFRARFVQSGPSGEEFASYGYVTRAAGATDADLFVGATLTESSARLTAYAEGRLTRRTIDQSVHSLDVEGTLTIYQLAGGGASFAVPESFRSGTPVARFDLTLQDILSVILPGKGVPTLAGAMVQTDARAIGGGVPGRRFGRIGSRGRMLATGVGTLVDPVTLNAVLEMAGHWVLE